MSWALILKPNTRTTLTVERSFHLTRATLLENFSDDAEVQVIIQYGNNPHIALCNLSGSSTLQQNQLNLDLTFEKGRIISFTTIGKSVVQLTGSLIPADEEGPGDKPLLILIGYELR